VKGRAFLEMWCKLPDAPESFSKGFHNAVSGSVDWTAYEIPFRLEKGQKPESIRLQVTIEGAGTVWIKDITLTKVPLKGAPALPKGHGKLIVENRHPRAELKITVISQVDVAKMLGDAFKLLQPREFERLSLDPEAMGLKLPYVAEASLRPGETWDHSLLEGQYEIRAVIWPPSGVSFPRTAFRPPPQRFSIAKDAETRLRFGDSSP